MDIGVLWLLGVRGGLTWGFWAVFEENSFGRVYVVDCGGFRFSLRVDGGKSVYGELSVAARVALKLLYFFEGFAFKHEGGAFSIVTRKSSQ